MLTSPMKRSTFILVIAAVVILAGAYVIRVGNDLSDFGVCYQAGGRIVQGETLYRPSDGHLQYKYSPASALFFSAFALLPYKWAKLLWYILEFVFLWGCYAFSIKVLPIKEKNRAALCVWTFLITLKFLARELELGQVNLFMIFILTLMLFFLLEKKDTASGLFWGVSLFFKPYALAFLPYFLIKKKLKVAAVGLGLFLAGLVLPALFYGFRGNLLVLKEWPVSLSASTSSLLSVYDNASLYAFLLKILPASWSQGAAVALVLLFLLLALLFFWMIKSGRTIGESPKPEVLESAFLFIMIPLFSPLGWYYNYLYSILAIMVIITGFKKFPLAVQIILSINFAMIGSSFIELWGKNLFRFYVRHSLVVINIFVVLLGLFYLRFKKLF
jgi:hypothetical protein